MIHSYTKVVATCDYPGCHAQANGTSEYNDVEECIDEIAAMSWIIIETYGFYFDPHRDVLIRPLTAQYGPSVTLCSTHAAAWYWDENEADEEDGLDEGGRG